LTSAATIDEPTYAGCLFPYSDVVAPVYAAGQRVGSASLTDSTLKLAVRRPSTPYSPVLRLNDNQRCMT
jgi:hypothetical protein